MGAQLLFSAPRVFLPRGEWLEPGAILVRGGRIEEVGEPGRLRERAPAAERIELAGCALLPGLVNAHAHLELSDLGPRLPKGLDFGAWVRALVAERAKATDVELEGAALGGARMCLESGATSVGDLDATGSAERAFQKRSRDQGPRIVQFRELLDARKPERLAHELARLAASSHGSEFFLPALAPHAPHTVSPQLLAAIGRRAKESSIALTTHWSETADENDWLESGRGPFNALLGESPRRRGLELLEDAGLLGPGLALVHGNQARPEEIARIARSGATLVHCPGSHAYFDRPAFDLSAWRAAGVPVALGTDSLASNGSLDMRREMSRFARSQPWLAPRELIDAATRHGARALGLAGRVGELSVGAFADLLAIAAPESDSGDLTQRVARGEFDVRAVWIGGRHRPFSEHGSA